MFFSLREGEETPFRAGFPLPPLDPPSPSRPAKGLSPLESQERFYASLRSANLERTEIKLCP